MEWVEGPSLHALLHGTRATARTIEQRLGFVVQAAETLASLLSTTRSGGNPSLHRDVKPTNCIVNDQRGLVLIDVSTLRLVNDGADALGRHTPEYTAPEVLRAPRSPWTAAADVYALGALTTFCLLGEDPPPAGTFDGARCVAGKLRAAGREADVAAPDALTAHIMATLDPDPLRRPMDLIAWSQRLLELSPEPSPLPRHQAGQRLRSGTPGLRTRSTVPAARGLSRRSLTLLCAACLLTLLLVGALTIGLRPPGYGPNSGLGTGSNGFGSHPSGVASTPGSVGSYTASVGSYPNPVASGGASAPLPSHV
jgi:serine/threonine protein kinase